MKKYMAYCLALIVFCFTGMTGIEGAITSKTLPKGVWKFDLLFNNYDMAKAGASKTGIATDNRTLSNWETVSIDEAVMRDIPSFRLFEAAEKNPALGIDLDTKLIHKWNKKQVKFDLAYGYNDNLTLFSNFAYENAEIDYTDEYVSQAKILNPLNDAGVTIPPDKATSSSLRDIFIGAKYNIRDNLSLAFRTSFGPLRIGVAPSEKTEKDLKKI